MLQEMKRYGIKDLPHNLSLSLGSISLSPLSLAKYYTSFANGGIQVEPLLIKRVMDGYGNTIEYESRRRYITSPQQSFLMTTILRDVVRRGTGRRAAVRGVEVAGKTGTTNKAMDAWFAGYTPSVETVVWFGNDDNTPMRKKETGGRVAGPAFRYFNERFLELYPHLPRKFEMPEGIIESEIDGVKEYFSDISKPPIESQEDVADDELIF